MNRNAAQVVSDITPSGVSPAHILSHPDNTLPSVNIVGVEIWGYRLRAHPFSNDVSSALGKIVLTELLFHHGGQARHMR